MARVRRTSAAALPPAHLPRACGALLASAAWQPLVQLADLRIRANRRAGASVGEIAEASAQDVVESAADLPVGRLAAAWLAWAEQIGRPAPAGVLALTTAERRDSSDDVEAALIVHADLAALLPQLVAQRMSENRR